MPPTEILYLCQPYSHDDPWVRQERYLQAIKASALLTQKGLTVYSPIMHSHPINWVGKGADDVHAFWMGLHIPFIKVCKKLLVLKLEGWDRSKGVNEEVETAHALGIPVEYATLEELAEL